MRGQPGFFDIDDQLKRLSDLVLLYSGYDFLIWGSRRAAGSG